MIDGRTNVPVRALSDALGVDLEVSGKTINITTSEGSQSNDGAGNETAGASPVNNKYIGSSKNSLEELKASIEDNILSLAYEGRKNILAEIEILKTSGLDGGPAPGVAVKEEQLTEYESIISKNEAELRLVNEALQALEN
ncbi:hypothetical protein ACE3MQ_06060 [Paenibacillus lentus]|uniref:hypothetical protein n=1 Tax=Paenibacillus lentus TaxID=1338368 RepID=UPI00364BE369